MEVNCGEFRNIEHLLCQNLAESKRNKEIRLNFSQFVEKIRVFSNGFRLKNRNIMAQSELFYGRRGKLFAASARAVGLRNNRTDFYIIKIEQFLDTIHRDLRSSHKNDFYH